MKNRVLTIAGVCACAVALGLNLFNAFDGYGIKEKNRLSMSVLANASNMDTGTGNDSYYFNIEFCDNCKRNAT